MSDIIYIDGQPYKVVVAVDKDGNAISGALPAGASTESKQDDQITELQAIKTAVQTVAAESDATTITGYIDSVGVRFLTRFDPTATQKIKHYRLDSGTAYSPVAPFELISSNIEVFNYVATAAGTGYSINDILVKFTDTETKSSAWRNETTNLAISSPISGTYSEIGKVGAATETKQNDQITELQAIKSLLDDYPITEMGRDANGNITSMTRTGPNNVAQTKTFTRDAQGRVTAISKWV